MTHTSELAVKILILERSLILKLDLIMVLTEEG
jgi:hypothetical protein